MGEYGLEIRIAENPRPASRWSSPGRVEIRVADLSEGFLVPLERFAVLTEEEIFGPNVAIYVVDSLEEAVRVHNASPYGLGGSVWSKSPDRAYAIANRMASGTVWVNKHADLMPNIPFGGAGQSGLGSELGEEGLAEFTQLQVINIAR